VYAVSQLQLLTVPCVTDPSAKLLAWIELKIGWEAGIRTPITWSREAGSGVCDFVSSWFC
jgi:hypothetical protein